VLESVPLDECDDRLGKRVVVGIAYAADRSLDTGFGQSLRVANRQILATALAVMDQATTRLARAHLMFSRIEQPVGAVHFPIPTILDLLSIAI
jgi:hypothetical protein